MDMEILVFSSTIEQKILKSCSSIIAAFFPGKNIIVRTANQGGAEQLKFYIEKTNTESPVFELGLLGNKNETVQGIDSQDISELLDIPLPGKEPLLQILVKRAIYIFLTNLTKEKIPWGILTGIRPGKLLAKMNNLGLDQAKQTSVLTDLYMLEKDKVELLRTIAKVQRPHLLKMNKEPKLISVFLMIPFCPSRCFYCSFPSYLHTAQNNELFLTYLQALRQEIKLTGEMMTNLGLKAACIYIGGGTPTILTDKEMQVLFQDIKQFIPTEGDLEYTVEAGRPDTLNQNKLRLMKEFNINRISINPQTMQDRSLSRIGRNHQVKDILDCYEMAREINDWTINMDLILGLPGEDHKEMIDSLVSVLELEPDNITVHALALKRGSNARQSHYTHSANKDWSMLQQETEEKLHKAGYRPYYLYRQKNIAGNLENVGYSIPGKECRYNIAIIEEEQMIIGLGACSSSKMLRPDTGHINLYHPLAITRYLECYQKMHEKRKELLQLNFTKC